MDGTTEDVEKKRHIGEKHLCMHRYMVSYLFIALAALLSSIASKSSGTADPLTPDSIEALANQLKTVLGDQSEDGAAVNNEGQVCIFLMSSKTLAYITRSPLDSQRRWRACH